MAEAFVTTIDERRFVFDNAAALAGLDRAEAYPAMLSLLPQIQRAPRVSRYALTAAGWATPLVFPLVLRLAAARAVSAIRSHERAVLHGDVALAASARIVESVARVPGEDRPRQWLVVPGVRHVSDIAGKVPAGDAVVHLYALAREEDVERAAASTRGIAHQLFSHRWPAATNLFVLELFDWCLLWHTIEEHGRNVPRWWITNHYDQWAVLLDRVDVPGARVLLQHGIEGEPTGHPVKLHRTSVLYSYDDYSELYFTRHIFAHPDTVRHERLSAAIALTPMPRRAGSDKQVLIIGSPLHLERERELVLALANAFPDAHILVKPHPLFSPAGYASLRNAGAELITDRALFPRVQLVVSPYSTLGLEYAASGVPVVWHADRPVADVMDEIAALLQGAQGASSDAQSAS